MHNLHKIVEGLEDLICCVKKLRSFIPYEIVVNNIKCAVFYELLYLNGLKLEFFDFKRPVYKLPLDSRGHVEAAIKFFLQMWQYPKEVVCGQADHGACIKHKRFHENNPLAILRRFATFTGSLSWSIKVAKRLKIARGLFS